MLISVSSPALSPRDIAVESVVGDTERAAGAVLAANQHIKAKCLRQTDVTVGTSDTRRAHTLAGSGITLPTRASALCQHTQHYRLEENAETPKEILVNA